MKLFLASILIVALQGCATAGPKSPPIMTIAWVSIDESYPVFTLTNSNPGNVKIPASKDQIAKWKAAATAYQAAQKEIEAAVSHYQPLAIGLKKKQIKP